MTRDVVRILAGISPGEWRVVAAKMSWHYRANRPLPDVLKRLFKEKGVPTYEEWRQISAAVSAFRKADRSAEYRELDKSEAARRRKYMRTYMRSYRKKAT